ncbi:MAG: DNA-directed RNA polymerase subunit omega [Melioribacteraceae bacterium]|nr:DNA-directed RNA polymerase subunit omega [Melioribacteraceae bacterium]
MAIQPLSLKKIKENASNLYEAVIVASRRARKLNDDLKLEFNTLLSSVTNSNDEQFEDKENPEQLKLSLEFDKREKPHIQAIKELRDGKVKFRYKSEK